MSVIQLDLRRNTGDLTVECLNAVGEVFDRYLVFPSTESRDAVVLWTLHTHVFQSFYTTPRLSVRSREPGSGKTLVLEILEQLAPNPFLAVDITPGVLWRTLENSAPTILVDEADTIFGRAGSSSSHRYLRGILNAGYRRGATVPRCVGTDDVKRFNVFGPVALAGLGRLPETLASRSVEIVMRKRKPGDAEVSQFRLQLVEEGMKRVRALCELWAGRASSPLKVAMPDLPVINRDADVWSPLCAIADLAGVEWSERSRTACKALTSRKERSIGPALLADIRRVFGDDDKLSTVDLIARLKALADSEWQHDTFTGRSMARLLAEYDVESQSIRQAGAVVRGYKRDAFIDAWTKYAEAE